MNTIVTLKDKWHTFCRSNKIYFVDATTGLSAEITSEAYRLIEAYRQQDSFNCFPCNIPDDIIYREVDKELKNLVEKGELLGTDCYSGWTVADMQKRPNSGIVIDVMAGCNLNCKYCYGKSGLYGGPRQEMSLNTAKKAIDMGLARKKWKGAFHIAFFGGEPLLNFEVIKGTVNYCKELTRKFNYIFTFGLTTNGTLLTQDIAIFLEQNRFAIMVSCDGGKEIHDTLRPYTSGEGSYETLKEKFSLLRNNSKVSVRGSLTQTTFQLCEMPSLLAAYKQFGAKSVFLTHVDVSKVDGAEGLAVGRKELSEYLRFCEQITRKSLGEMQAGQSPDSFFRPLAKALKLVRVRQKQRKTTGCGVAAAMITVAPDGCIYPCHRFVGMRPFVIGTVDKGVDDNKTSEILLRAGRSQKKCKTCWARCFCGGICVYGCADKEGNFHPPPEDDCLFAKEAMEIAVALLAEYPELDYQKIFDYAKDHR